MRQPCTRNGIGLGKLVKQHLRQDILRQTHPDYTVLEIYVQTGYRVLCAEKPQTADKHVYPLCFFS